MFPAGPMVKRLRDTDWEVRHAAVARLCEVAKEDPCALLPTTYLEIAERMKDRKPTVRRLALTSLARLYHKHLSSVRRPLDELPERELEEGRTDMLERFSLVPGFVLSYWGWPDAEDRHLVIQVFF